MVTAAPAPSPPPPVARVVFGRSVQGRPLSFVRVGDRDAPVRVLVVGCVHGNECAGLRILRILERRRSPRGTALWIVPTLNPDGVAVGSRGNAHAVDLNRNYPWRWGPTGPPGSVYYAGPRPRSEPETRSLQRLVRRVRPQASIWYHQHLRLVYRQHGARPRLIRAYAHRVGLPLRRSPAFTGTAIGWENRLMPGSTAWVVELPAGAMSHAAARRHARAVLGVARALRR
jgi:protein MpaA